MCQKLERTFDICPDRALRLTTMVRLLRGAEGYESVFGVHDSDRHDRLKKQLIDNLDESLEAQPSETVEARWNNLMDELDCPSRADKGVYLVPWGDHDADDWQQPGVSQARPE
jgi:hypothetical protein